MISTAHTEMIRGYLSKSPTYIPPPAYFIFSLNITIDLARSTLTAEQRTANIANANMDTAKTSLIGQTLRIPNLESLLARRHGDINEKHGTVKGSC